MHANPKNKDLTDVTNSSSAIKLSAEALDEAKKLVDSTLKLFVDHVAEMNRKRNDFDKSYTETRKAIQQGARRSSGRIV